MDRNLIGEFGGVVKEVIINKRNLYSPSLQQSALLAFCKFMCISRVFCEDNLNVCMMVIIKIFLITSCYSLFLFVVRMSMFAVI